MDQDSRESDADGKGWSEWNEEFLGREREKKEDLFGIKFEERNSFFEF